MTSPFACPRGHRNVQLATNRFHCDTCKKYHDRPHNWDKSELVDLRRENQGTGRVLEEP